MLRIPNSITNIASKEEYKTIGHIHLDADKQKIIATNGNTMVLIEPNEPIKKSLFIRLPKIAGKLLDFNQDTLEVTNGKGLTGVCKLLESSAIYPDVFQCIPRDEPVASIALSIPYLQDILKTLLDNQTECTKIRLDLYGEKTPVKITLLEESKNRSYGVIAPLVIEK